jgi:hypothetical protein
MRNLFICFLMATVANLVQRGPEPVIEPATYLGILVVFPILGARLFRNWRLPPAVGAIAGGAILGQSGLFEATMLDGVASFRDAAFVWIGLYVGTRISRVPTLRTPNLAVASAILVTTTLMVCLATAYLPLTLLEQLQIGLAGAMCAPLFTALVPDHHLDEIGLSGLVTLLAFVLLGVATFAHTYGQEIASTTILAPGAVGVIGCLLAAELVFHSLKSAASGPGRYLIFIVTMGILWRAAMVTGVHPTFLGCLVGILVGMRTRQRQDLTAPLAESSSFAASFVLGFVSAETGWHHLIDAPQAAWMFGFAVVLPMIVGKGVAGLVAANLTHTSRQRWLRTVPFGLAAMIALPAVVPERLFLGSVVHPEQAILPTLLLGAVVVPLAGNVIDRLRGYLASRRKAAASSGGMELT